ncbi:hypothetical protein PAXRUDRAFT_493684 [Paxillus rubicundulus Ve08.2h10]|uniref:Uncharacterized protein n=1 Tax=Paxillus rubicundulus Ve08.2h10 TaxID=930991 RepID=A0A0D0DPB1_9AGAM|nr:hypothetical protein PAXRUDRAFT_493684 [Paxillus rubicundulus Ve08.2h10]
MGKVVQFLQSKLPVSPGLSIQCFPVVHAFLHNPPQGPNDEPSHDQRRKGLHSMNWAGFPCGALTQF